MKKFRKIGTILMIGMIFTMLFSVSAFAATAAPTGVTVTAGSGALNVSWTTVSGADGYNVYVGGVKHNTTLVTGLTYTITSLVNGTSYAITVKSYDNSDSSESAASTAVNATPIAGGGVDFSGTSLPFSVGDMLGTAVNFLILYGEWVLLALGVIFAPVLYGLAMKLVRSVKKSSAS